MDPTSAFNLKQQGIALQKAGRAAEAQVALDHALTLSPVVDAYLTQATMATDEGRFADRRN
jgi:hypothetical protein